MAPLSLSSISILPSQNPISSSLSFSSYHHQIRHRGSVVPLAVSHRLRPRRKRHRKRSGMSFILPLSCRGDEPFLDSRNSSGNGDSLATEMEQETSTSTSLIASSRMKNKYTANAGRFRILASICARIMWRVAMVYFVQGVLGISRLAVSFYLKDDLHLDPAETAVISGFSSLPWLVKPLYGFISPTIWLSKKVILGSSGLLGALSWSLMATFSDSKYAAVFCILLGSLSVAFSDVIPWLWRGLVGNHKACQGLFSLYAGDHQLLVVL
ncbi:hypothetical protein GQ457_HM001130 [Hibiscus cannabinus]